MSGTDLYSGYIYLIFGVMAYLSIKLASDRLSLNKAIYFRHGAYRTEAITVSKATIEKALSLASRISDEKYATGGIAADKSVKNEALRITLGCLPGLLHQEELEYLLSEESTSKQSVAKYVYEKAINTGEYSIQKNVDALLEKNSIITPDDLNGTAIKAKKCKKVLLLNAKQDHNFRRTIRNSGSGNGLLLYLICNRTVGLEHA